LGGRGGAAFGNLSLSGGKVIVAIVGCDILLAIDLQIKEEYLERYSKYNLEIVSGHPKRWCV